MVRPEFSISDDLEPQIERCIEIEKKQINWKMVNPPEAMAQEFFL
jgi:hypothetical protein